MSSLGSKRSSSGYGNKDLNVPYESALKISQEYTYFHQQAESISSLDQRLAQLHDQPQDIRMLKPQRMRLRTKRGKRCVQCDSQLIKPEQKTTQSKFKEKLMARFCLSNCRQFLPIISIESFSKLVLKQTCQLILRFENPLAEDVEISIQCPFPKTVEELDGENCSVELTKSTFVVKKTGGSTGIFGSGTANFVDLLINFVPMEKTTQLPLLVSFRRQKAKETLELSFWISVIISGN